MIIECNTTKLLDEFNQAGISPYPVFDSEDGTGDFTFPEGTDMNLVQQIIDAHDPTRLSQPETPAEKIARLEEENADLWYQNMISEGKIEAGEQEVASLWYEVMTMGGM